MFNFLKKLPGFSSGSKLKIAIASIFYFFLALFLLVLIVPSPPKEQKISKEGEQTGTQLVAPGVESIQTEVAKVTRVIDGDTIEIEGGKRVRYIGVDSPEPPGCFSFESTTKNRELVLDKEVRLEKDVSETDKYGRLLRYVWIDNLMVNEELVKQGYAAVATYPPDVKYKDRFLEGEKGARSEGKGLWGTGVCPTTTTVTPIPKSPTTQEQSPSPIKDQGFSCAVKKTCSQMISCEEAYYHLNVCGYTKRDADGDGVPCENICPGGQ